MKTAADFQAEVERYRRQTELYSCLVEQYQARQADPSVIDVEAFEPPQWPRLTEPVRPDPAPPLA